MTINTVGCCVLGVSRRTASGAAYDLMPAAEPLTAWVVHRQHSWQAIVLLELGTECSQRAGTGIVLSIRQNLRLLALQVYSQSELH